MTTNAELLATHTPNASYQDEKSTPVWPNAPDPLKDYYHDCHIYNKDGQALFVSATFTECFIGPDHSHESIFQNTCPHKTSLLYFEFTPSAWRDTVFNERSGFNSPLHWDSNLDIKSLTGLSLESLTEHNAVSSPERTFTARPSAIFGICPSFDDDLVYPEGLNRALPIFRPTDPGIATYLFVKVPWLPNEDTPERVEITSYTPLTGLHYWCAINDFYRIGVDYWLVPLAKQITQKPPAP